VRTGVGKYGGVEMNRNSARLLAQNPQILKRLAKYMAQQCFRNTVLEDFHAGVTPYSEAGDYSDVVVKTPAGPLVKTLASQRSRDEDAYDRCGQPDLFAAPDSVR
jgi:hypothetical protein